MVLNVLAYEAIGVSAGGMVVPGYLALFLDQPARVAATLVLGWLVWVGVARGLGRAVVLYGRRRYGAMLVGGLLATWGLAAAAPYLDVGRADVRAIGYIVPGLLANEMERQGVWPTVAMTLALAVLTRLTLWLFAGWGW